MCLIKSQVVKDLEDKELLVSFSNVCEDVNCVD